MKYTKINAKTTENGMEMYVFKVFNEMLKKTKMYAKCLWKCQSDLCISINQYSNPTCNLIRICL